VPTSTVVTALTVPVAVTDCWISPFETCSVRYAGLSPLQPKTRPVRMMKIAIVRFLLIPGFVI